MKKSAYQAAAILYQHLDSGTSPLKSAITGAVFREQRPTGSEMEDVVINTLVMGTNQTQIGRLVVNIYVKDLDVPEFAICQDDDRLDELATIAINQLAEGGGAAYSFSCETQTVEEEAATGFHYASLRIDFRFYPD